MFKTVKEVWNSLDTKERSYLKLGLSLILIIGVVSIFILPWVFTRESWSFLSYNQAATAAIGDTINGISAPFIALLVAILTFLAFYIQYKANIQQRQQFFESLKKQKEEGDEQQHIWRIERFENKFYELLKLHKANVTEMNIANRVKGRECFIYMFYELRFCFQTATDFYNNTLKELKEEYNYNEINLMHFSYSIFFFGIGLYSEKHFIKSFKPGEMHLFRQLKPFLENIQKQVIYYFKKDPEARPLLYNLPLSGIPDEKTVEFFYVPFDGHVNILGHYYRHLFQTANYIITQDFLNTDGKYSYMKTLRAQLSDFEQLLLYYNSLAWFEEEWKEIFTTYRFIKNLSLPLADFYYKPENYFHKEILELRGKGIAMFEYHE